MLQLSQCFSRQVTVHIWACRKSSEHAVTKGLHNLLIDHTPLLRAASHTTSLQPLERSLPPEALCPFQHNLLAVMISLCHCSVETLPPPRTSHFRYTHTNVTHTFKYLKVLMLCLVSCPICLGTQLILYSIASWFCDLEWNGVCPCRKFQGRSVKFNEC